METVEKSETKTPVSSRDNAYQHPETLHNRSDTTLHKQSPRHEYFGGIALALALYNRQVFTKFPIICIISILIDGSSRVILTSNIPIL